MRSPSPSFAFIALSIAAAWPAWAQNTAGTEPTLPRVVVTGAREPTAANLLAADVIVIDAQRIRASTADSVEDLLRREAGLQMSRSGGPGASAGLFIRGAGVGNTLVLVDGVRIGSATLGQVEFEGLSLAAIDHIEVLRGPASSLYGADGSGGVVQIFTRRGDGTTRVGAAAAVGGYGAREASFNASGSVGAFDLAGALSHERLDGVSSLRPGDRFGNYNPDRDGAKRSTAQAQVGFVPATGQRLSATLLKSRLDSQYDASQYLPPAFAQDATPDFRSRLDNQVASIEHRGTWSPMWTTLLRLSGQESDLHSGASIVERYRTQRRQIDAQGTWNITPDQHLTLAYEGLREKALSTSYLADVQRDNDAAVLAYAGAAGPVQLQADVRHDRNSVFGNVNTGRVGASVPLATGWRMRTLVGTSYRAPSFNDLYFPDYGVPNIQPERGHSVELGLEGRFGNVDVSATAWRNRVRELIAYESDRSFCPPDPGYNFGCARNVGRAKLQGLSLNGGARLDALNLRATLEFLDAIDSITGQRLPRRAAHQATLAGDYSAGAWTLGAAVLNVGERPDSGNVKLAAYTTLDLKAQWRITPQWSFETKLLNATDRDIEPARDYQALGRQAWVGVRYALTGL